jgi:hypothetical protein
VDAENITFTGKYGNRERKREPLGRGIAGDAADFSDPDFPAFNRFSNPCPHSSANAGRIGAYS